MKRMTCLILLACACAPQGLLFEDEGVPLGGGPHVVADFVGNGVVASSPRPGEVKINIPGIVFLSSGVTVPGAPHTKVSFAGAGVRTTNGGGGRLEAAIPGNITYLPERWFQDDVGASQVNAALGTRVSPRFPTFRAQRDGSIVGASTRLTAPVASGTLIVNVTVNGVIIGLSMTHDAISSPSGQTAAGQPGNNPYAAGDLIGVELSTDGGFSPATTDLEVAVSVFEQP